MKKLLCGLLSLLLLFTICTTTFAVDDSQSYRYELTVDGRDTKEVRSGDIITVVLTVYRTDTADPYTMYAMQDEIRYDSEFFELVEGSVIPAKEITTRDIALRDQHREFYMNYLSFGGGAKWEQKSVIGSFQLKVIATTGVSKLTNQDCQVSLRDGSDSYLCEANTLTVILSTDCLVKFETNGGSELESVTVTYGERITKPQNPTKAGKIFAGWYQDIDLKEAWDFDKDTVQSNMTLYAKWEDAPNGTDTPGTDTPGTDKPGSNGSGVGKLDIWFYIAIGAIGALILLLLLLLLLGGKRTVTFETNGGSKVKPVKVRRNSKLKYPKLPVKPGMIFIGWYQDIGCTQPWRFEADKVKKDMTLYAKWQ